MSNNGGLDKGCGSRKGRSGECRYALGIELRGLANRFIVGVSGKKVSSFWPDQLDILESSFDMQKTR